MPIYVWCKVCKEMVLKELQHECDHTPNETTKVAMKEALGDK